MTDTTPEALAIWQDLQCRRSPVAKWRSLGDAFASARALHAAGLRLRQPNVAPEETVGDWLNLAYRWRPGRRECSDNDASIPISPSTMNAPANLAVLAEVLAVFDHLDILYALGGSMASSVHGIPRFTQDADITVRPFPGKEETLTAAFGPDYYVSLPAIQDAVRTRGSFNIINTREGFKVDVFIAKDDPFEQEAMRRRIAVPLLEGKAVFIQSPEDVCLFKLRWYRLGGETSEQQWKDVLGVMQTLGTALDIDYLRHWAPRLGLDDLLTKALDQTPIH
ncbi:MAG: hypothetical protein U0793_18390 [Gemmataceae bacterium]